MEYYEDQFKPYCPCVLVINSTDMGLDINKANPPKVKEISELIAITTDAVDIIIEGFMEASE